LLILNTHASAQAQANEANVPIRFDGVYECKDWKVNGVINHAAPAYFRFFTDGAVLFCRCANAKENFDSLCNPKEICNNVLSETHLDKIKKSIMSDPTAISKTVDKFVLTAYSYKMLMGGICYDVLSESPSCAGRPNLKIIDNKTIRTDDGDPADDRDFKFVQVER